MDEWGMLEICMLGILVSIIKLKDLAQISYGIGLFCFVLLLTISLVASVTLDEHKYWSLIKKVKSLNPA
jgi:paraquat-inducible protein A